MARTKRDDTAPDRLKMRRQPQQQRSLSTVEFIKEATLSLLATGGMSACAPDRIARKAGVSVGSFYKYFPNRDAILRAIYEDVSLGYAHMINALMRVVLELPVQDGMQLTISEMLAFHKKNHLVLLKLSSEAPELKLEQQPIAAHNLVRSNIRAYLQHRNKALSSAEVIQRCFFIEQFTFSSLQGYLSSMPPLMSETDFCSDLAKVIVHIVSMPARQAKLDPPRKGRKAPKS